MTMTIRNRNIHSYSAKPGYENSSLSGSKKKPNDTVDFNIEGTESGSAFTRLFKGETMCYVFHNNGSSERNEARCFIARQVYVS